MPTYGKTARARAYAGTATIGDSRRRVRCLIVNASADSRGDVRLIRKCNPGLRQLQLRRAPRRKVV